MVQTEAPGHTVPGLSRWTCSGCGEEVVAQEEAAVAFIRATHHCPPAESDPIVMMALRGEFDG